MRYYDTMKKYPTSYRLSEQALRLLALIAEHKGVNQTDALELMIRDTAKRERIQVKESANDRLRNVSGN